jgi:hypothetical protein
VENLRVDVEFDPSITTKDSDGTVYYSDENHAENFAVFENAKNGWVRDVTALHLSISMASAKTNAKWITIQDSRVQGMVSTLDGGRRYAIYYEGQQILTQRVQVDSARHAFIVSSRVEGPNVFLDSTATNNHNTIEPHHRWSVGGLFDNVDAPIAIQDRGWLGSGHGWAGANWVAWNTEGSLALQKPPTAQNYAIGFTGIAASHAAGRNGRSSGGAAAR